MKRLKETAEGLLALFVALLIPIVLAILCGTLDFQAATSGPNF